MANKVTITNNNNKVVITPQKDNSITARNTTTPVNIIQSNTNVVTINTPGPRGNRGPTGLTGGDDLSSDILGRDITSSGNMSVAGTIELDSLILTSPDGTRYKFTAENGGGFVAEQLS